MRYFPDEPAKGMWARYAVVVFPLLYLIVALLYSANSAPWGRQVGRRYLDPISLTLVAAFLAFAAQLVATSKHFNLHYMIASWVLTGGVLVLTVIETRRLFPRLSPRAIVGSLALSAPC
jgi:hypothetical protein